MWGLDLTKAWIWPRRGSILWDMRICHAALVIFIYPVRYENLPPTTLWVESAEDLLCHTCNLCLSCEAWESATVYPLGKGVEDLLCQTCNLCISWVVWESATNYPGVGSAEDLLCHTCNLCLSCVVWESATNYPCGRKCGGLAMPHL